MGLDQYRHCSLSTPTRAPKRPSVCVYVRGCVHVCDRDGPKKERKMSPRERVSVSLGSVGTSGNSVEVV